MRSNDITRQLFLQATGKVISSKRKKHNITQKVLGNKIGVSATTIGRYEKGELDIPSSNLPLISKYCDFKLREYLKGWESADLESFIKESLTIDTIEPDHEIIQEYINSCTKEELSDLEEISYCVSVIENDAYKQIISDLVIEYHLNNVNQERHKKLMAYYKRLCQLKENNIKTKEKNNGTNINT